MGGENASDPSDPDFYMRKVDMLELYNGARWDDVLAGGNASMLVLSSASLGVGMQGLQADFFASSLSNIVYPAVSYAYFAREVNVSFDDSQHELSLETSASGMATVFTRLLQFVDVDNDGIFTEGTDVVMDEYQFVEMDPKMTYAKPKPAWDLGEVDRSAKHARISTRDGVFAVVMKANNKSGKTPGGSTLTPMNTKIDVEINYPGLQEGNLIGLETYVVSTKKSASMGVSQTRGFYIPQEGNHSSLGFTWDGEADIANSSNGTGVAVGASAVMSAEYLLGAIGARTKQYLLGAIGARSSPDASLEVDRIIFSFNVSTPGKVLWDPTVGINEPEPSAPTSSPTAAPTACSDTARWIDDDGYSCKSWDGHNCSEAVEKRGYTEQAELDLLCNCARTCGTCGTCAQAPTPTPPVEPEPEPEPTPAPTNATLISGASSVACWVMTFVAGIMPVALTVNSWLVLA